MHSFVATTKLEVELRVLEFSDLWPCYTHENKKPFFKQGGRQGLTPNLVSEPLVYCGNAWSALPYEFTHTHTGLNT